MRFSQRNVLQGVDSAAFYLKRCFAIKARLRLIESVWRERQELSELTEEQLKDIGIRREDAENEARRTWTDLPSNRVDH